MQWIPLTVALVGAVLVITPTFNVTIIPALSCLLSAIISGTPMCCLYLVGIYFQKYMMWYVTNLINQCGLLDLTLSQVFIYLKTCHLTRQNNSPRAR